jgi:MarR family transcriptional regulator, lower aerobic nicotinate degradation pathway regulator
MASTSNTTFAAESERDVPAGRFGNMWARPGFLIRRLHQIQVGLFTEECGKFDITPVQFGFLTVLYEEGELDQITLSAAVGVDRTSGADVIKRLARRALLTRMPSTIDRRAKVVRITDEGHALVEQIFPCMVRSQERFISPLSASEQAQLNSLLTRLIEANDSASRAPLRKDVWASRPATG